MTVLNGPVDMLEEESTRLEAETCRRVDARLAGVVSRIMRVRFNESTEWVVPNVVSSGSRCGSMSPRGQVVSCHVTE